MKESVASKKRAFPRLTLPMLIGLILSLPLAACGSKREAEAAKQTDTPLLIDASLNSAALLRAPAPKVFTEDHCSDCVEPHSATFGERATVGGAHDKNKCDAKLQYGDSWAERMPPEFPVYPKGRVQEAAGVDGGLCNIRVASFTTSAPLQKVVDYYYTRAVKSGFDAEYLIRAGAHILGGTRTKDDGAYVITLEPNKGGGTAVGIVASNGRS